MPLRFGYAPDRDGKMATDDSKRTIGWRELVSLPDWGIRGVEAKVETGARTSSLHVENVKHFPDNTVRFEVVLSRRDHGVRVQAEAPLVRWSTIKTSTGHRQERLIVSTLIRVGEYEREIEMSLVSRKGLLCRMLLGRTALANDLVVDPSRRYVLSRAEAEELGVRAKRKGARGHGVREKASRASMSSRKKASG